MVRRDFNLGRHAYVGLRLARHPYQPVPLHRSLLLRLSTATTLAWPAVKSRVFRQLKS